MLRLTSSVFGIWCIAYVVWTQSVILYWLSHGATLLNGGTRFFAESIILSVVGLTALVLGKK
jgi:hypothetical protein